MPPRPRQTAGRPKSPPRKVMPPLPEPPADAVGEDDDFLRFWAAHKAEQKPETTTILGVEVVVPDDVPLAFDDLEERMATSKADADSKEAKALFEEMLAMLFGEDTYAQWRERGITSLQLRVITTWGMVNAKGRKIDFAEAMQLTMDAETGKATGPNRAARRTAAKASSKSRVSARTGARSRQISGANTESPPES